LHKCIAVSRQKSSTFLQRKKHRESASSVFVVKTIVYASI
jgi:hypothetical protein